MILIPAHNEAASIGPLVEAARRRYDAPVVVIDDRSTDGTPARARAAGARVVLLPLRLGAWGAIQTGLRLAQREHWPLAVTLDADGQHEVSQITRLISALSRDTVDVVIGAHPDRASGMRRLAWRYLRGFTGFGLEDITSGFRAYNRAAIAYLAKPDATLLEYQDIGVLLLLRRQGFRIREVPVSMGPRIHGHSRIFATWGAVIRYMVHTSLLCLARVGEGTGDERHG